MRITIEGIDANAMQRLGCMQVPGFSTQFSSSVVRGCARFVPANPNTEGCVGQSFDVEINQERVTGLKRVNVEAFTEAVVALPEPGAFHVCGTVTAVVPLSEPAGNKVVSVVAGEAVFTLCGEELRETELSLGQKVAFVAHELSLWDEAI